MILAPLPNHPIIISSFFFGIAPKKKQKKSRRFQYFTTLSPDHLPPPHLVLGFERDSIWPPPASLNNVCEIALTLYILKSTPAGFGAGLA
jgi:hypothetical protein